MEKPPLLPRAADQDRIDLVYHEQLVSLSICTRTLKTIVPNAFENDPALWLAQLPRPGDAGNKYTRGHALISGGYPMTGAARMAARAAARAGAGLTTIAVAETALPIYAAALTGIMVQPIAAPADFDRLLGDRRILAFLIGPSLIPSFPLGHKRIGGP